MRYGDEDRESSNVEDRPGQGGGGGLRVPGGGGRGGIESPVGGRGGMGLTALRILGAIMLFFGIHPLDILLGGGGGGIQVPNMPDLPEQSQPQRRADRSPLD